MEKVILQTFHYCERRLQAAFASSVSTPEQLEGGLDIIFSHRVGVAPPLLEYLWLLDLQRIPPAPGSSLVPADLNEVVSFIQRITTPGLLVPAYDADALESGLRALMARAAFVVHQAVAHDAAGQPVGWFVWLLSDETREARVVELIAAADQELTVLAALLRDARKRGAKAVIGEAHPRWLKAVGGVNARFVRNPRPVKVWSRETSVLTAILRGDYIWSGLPAVSLW